MDSVGQDLRHTLRIFHRAPVFYAGAILTLALGLGANGAVFSILQAVLLQPLPYDHPNEVVMVWRSRAQPPTGPNAALQGVNWHRGLLTAENVMDWREQSKDVLGDFAALKSWRGNLEAQFDLVLGEGAERLRAAFVTPNFFDLLGVSAARGRRAPAGTRRPCFVGRGPSQARTPTAN
jgi:putative ABC transport system permease protein